MSYVPDADQVTEPIGSRFAGSAAEEFRAVKSRLMQTFRVPEAEPAVDVLPPVASRANKTWTTDALGRLTFTVPVSGSIGDFASQLADPVDQTKGANMTGYGYLKNYVARTVGWKLNNLGLTVDDFKYLDDGSILTDAQAFQAAATYAATLIGTAPFNDRGVTITVTPRIYDVDATTYIPDGRISFAAVGGPATAIIRASTTVFDFGDHAVNAARSFSNGVSGLTFQATVTNNTVPAILLYRTAETEIKACTFIDWYIHLDCYRVSEPIIENCKSALVARTTQALAVMRLQGTDETNWTPPSTYTPGGGFNVSKCKFNGANATVDTQYCYLLMSADGFYESDTHKVGFVKTWGMAPAATPENRVIVSVRSTNSYIDEPSLITSGGKCVSIEGTVKQSIIAADGNAYSSLYLGIQFNGGEIRAANSADYAIFLEVVDGDSWWDYTNQKLQDILIQNCVIKQAKKRAIYFKGADFGARVEPRNVLIQNNTFSGNNVNGEGGASDISIDIESAVIAGNTFGPAKTTGADYIILARAQDVGATDEANPSVIIVDNDLTKALDTSVIAPIMVTNVIDSNTLVAGNRLPGKGRKFDQVEPKTTTDATPTLIWSYLIPNGQAGSMIVNLVGSTVDGEKSVIYTWRVTYYRRTSTGSAITAVALDTVNIGAVPAPTLTLATNTIRVDITGIAATTISWNCDHQMVTSR